DVDAAAALLALARVPLAVAGGVHPFGRDALLLQDTVYRGGTLQAQLEVVLPAAAADRVGVRVPRDADRVARILAVAHADDLAERLLRLVAQVHLAAGEKHVAGHLHRDVAPGRARD